MDDRMERFEGCFENWLGNLYLDGVCFSPMLCDFSGQSGVWTSCALQWGQAWCWPGRAPSQATLNLGSQHLDNSTERRGSIAELRRENLVGGRRRSELGGRKVAVAENLWWWANKHAMARLRHRQPCRRGRGSSRDRERGQANREHHHCCCQFCHRRAGVAPLQAEQFVEVGGANMEGPALPAFGSVVFTLGKMGVSHGVSAHISVLFTRTPEAEGEGSPSAGEVPPPDIPGPEQPLLPPSSEATTSGKAVMDDPSSSQAARARDAAKWAAMWKGIPEGLGWCEIVEEKPSEEVSPSPARP